LSKYGIFLKNGQNTACKTTIWFHFSFPSRPGVATFLVEDVGAGNTFRVTPTLFVALGAAVRAVLFDAPPRTSLDCRLDIRLFGRDAVDVEYVLGLVGFFPGFFASSPLLLACLFLIGEDAAAIWFWLDLLKSLNTLRRSGSGDVASVLPPGLARCGFWHVFVELFAERGGVTTTAGGRVVEGAAGRGSSSEDSSRNPSSDCCTPHEF
jgi:hypothetical protein